MSTVTFFVSRAQIDAAIASIPASLPNTVSSGTEYRFGVGNYEEIYRGQGLSFIGGSWQSGTLTGWEVRLAGVTLVRYEGFATPATGNNSLSMIDLALTGSNDTVIGSPFADELFGLSGNDVISGGAGNDRLFEDGGNDQYDGGPGLDTLDQRTYVRSNVDLTPIAGGGWQVFDKPLAQTDTIQNIEYMQFSDGRVSLLDLALGAPVAPDTSFTQVYRFAKVDSGQYFYTGNLAERNQIIASLPNFRYEGAVYTAQDNWVTGYDPVYRFANLANGGYFYTASAAERDSVISDFPNFRYEGATFFVPAAASASTVPVYRLANLNTGGYLFTSSAAERAFAVSLGNWRDEGTAFNAPRTESTPNPDPGNPGNPGGGVWGGVDLAQADPFPADHGGDGWLI